MPAEYTSDPEARSLFDEVADDLGFALHKIGLLGRMGYDAERLRLALKATNDVVWDWNVVDDTQRWNESGAIVFGWTDIVEAPQSAAWWLDRVHPGDRRRVEQAFHAAVGDSAVDRWSDEYRFRRADGAYAIVADRGHVLRDAEGRAVRMVGAMLDVTHRRQAEDALRSSRQLLEATEWISGFGGWEYDVATGSIVWTEGAYKIHEFDPAGFVSGSPEHIGRSLDCYEPGDRTRVSEAFRRCLETGESYDLECDFTTAAGRHLRVRTMGRAIREGDRIVRVIGNIQDVTGQTRVREELRASRETVQALINATDDCVFLMDPEGTIVAHNEETARRLGRPESDLVGMNMYDYLPEPVVRHRREWVSTVMRTGRPLREEDRRDDVVLDSTVYPLYDSTGRVTRIAVFSRDITEGKRVQEALWQSRSILRAVLDNIPARVFWKDRALNYLGCNVAFARDAGFEDPQQIVGKDDFDTNWRGQAERYRRDDREVIETGNSRLLYAEPQTTPSGGTIHLLTSKVPLRDAGGAVIGVLGTYMDVSELKRAEVEREHLTAQLLQSQKMESVGRLAGGVAHDFNNLLMGIMNYTELCRDGIPAEHPVRAWLDEIMTEARRSADLVRQLLLFARKHTVQPEALDLNERIGGILRMLGRLIGERIELSWSPEAALRLVSADPSHIDQVMANLCVNAADAIAGNGRIAISTRTVVMDEAACAGMPGMAPGAYVQLTVADTGCGMDAETLSHVFEPFFTTKEVGQGTGLGLATVYGIVKQSEGFIQVESARGAGTTFRIYLPVLDGPGEETAACAEAGPPPGGSQTILVVDDERSIRVTTAAHLERLGYRVLTAEGPDRALALAGEHAGTIDLLLSDMVMPGMGGVELRERLATLCPGVKTIFMTGFSAAESAGADGAGSDGMRLAKPVPLRDLAVAIRTVLGDPGAETK